MTASKIVSLFFIFFCFAFVALASDEPLDSHSGDGDSNNNTSSMGLELVPKGRPFRLTFADPREIQMMLTFSGSSQIWANIGNYFSIFKIRPTQNSDWQIHFGLEGAGFFSMRQADSRFPLETADGLIGAYAEGANGPLQAQLRYTHISAHLADGDFSLAPIAYSREFLSLRFGYLFTRDVFTYYGVQYLTNSIPSLPPWTFQTGGTFFFPLGGASKLTPFTAFDMKYQQDTVYNPSLSVQIGIAINNPGEAYHSFRLFYWYYTGADPRGQYYNHEYTSNSVGLEMQI